jgi:hypothetical protein
VVVLVTDLRDQLADLDTAAVPTCHPDRPAHARHLCRSCYETAWKRGTLHRHQPQKAQRSRADFIADYRMLRRQGHTRQQIADRLGMNLAAVHAAYYRAARAGDLPREHRSGSWEWAA